MAENNGWSEHKIYVKEELAHLRKDVDDINMKLQAHILEEAKFWGEVKAELKYHNKIIVVISSIVSAGLSSLMFLILSKVI